MRHVGGATELLASPATRHNPSNPTPTGVSAPVQPVVSIGAIIETVPLSGVSTNSENVDAWSRIVS